MAYDINHFSGEELEIGDSLAVRIKRKLRKLDALNDLSLTCIYKVPKKLRKVNKYAYTPAVVAISPYHRGRKSLQAMEEYKWRSLKAILAETEKLEECIKALRMLEPRARKCYSESINLSSNKLVEMMLVDGLFIVHFLCNKVLVTTNWMRVTLMNDIILLENQLPMFVLKTLFDLTNVHCQHSLTQLAIEFFNHLKPKYFEVSPDRNPNESKHLLDLLGKTLHASFEGTSYIRQWEYLPCVTKLREAGVKFQKGSGTIFNIKYVNGVLQIPPIDIDDHTDSFLRNLIALEQWCYGDDTHVTSYASLMDSLINSADDVGFLCRRGIITNFLGNDEDVATLFNKLCIDVTIGNFYYSQMCVEVKEHYEKRQNVWKATLNRNYFSSPWKILSFCAGILLLFLSFTGTLFSILSFFVHKS